MRIMDNPMTPERERECWQASRSGHALAGMVGELLLALSVARNGISHMAGASKQALRERDALRQAVRDLRVLRSSCADSHDGDFRVHLSEKEFDALCSLAGASGAGTRALRPSAERK
jgi:hypothetical protein